MASCGRFLPICLTRFFSHSTGARVIVSWISSSRSSNCLAGCSSINYLVPLIARLRRIGIIRTRKCTSNSPSRIRLFNQLNRSIGSRNTQKDPQRNHGPMQPIGKFLPQAPHSPISIIVKPEPRRQNKRRWGKTYTPRQSNQVIENRYSFSEDEGDKCEAEGTGEPGKPVNEGVRLEVRRIA